VFKRILFSLSALIIATFFSSAVAFAGTMTPADGEKLKDPTQPFEWAKPKQKTKAKQSYKLNYLLYASERKQAIINGKAVTVGDRVSGAKVLKITESSVLLSVDGGTKVLRWKQPMSIKRTR